MAGVAVDAKDNVFCFSRGEHPVIVFDRDGKFLRSWGEGQIRRAHGISLDAEGMLWLTDDLHHTSRKLRPRASCSAPSGIRHALLPSGRQAVQPAHPRRRLPAHRQPVSFRRLREFPRPQVHAGRPASAVLGRARHRSRPVQSPPQPHHRPDRSSTWPIARITASRSSTGRGATRPSGTTCTGPADFIPIGARAITSTWATRLRASRYGADAQYRPACHRAERQG